jgi:hypothetical protein
MPAFLDYVLELMQRFAGELDLAILRKIRDHVAEHHLDMSSGQASIDLILAYLFIYEEVLDETLVSRIITRFNADVSSGVVEKAEGALFFVGDILRSTSREPSIRPLAASFASHCASQVKWKHWQLHLGQEATMPKFSLSRQNLAEWTLLRSTRLAAELDNSGAPVIVLDLDTIFNDLFTVRKPRIVVAGREPATGVQHSTIRMPLSILTDVIPQQEHGAATEVLRRGITARVGI